MLDSNVWYYTVDLGGLRWDAGRKAGRRLLAKGGSSPKQRSATPHITRDKLVQYYLFIAILKRKFRYNSSVIVTVDPYPR